MPKCKAMLSNRTRQCAKEAMAGQEVCDRHGGRSPRALAAAERRLAEQKAREALADQDLWDPNAIPTDDPIASLQKLSGRLEHMVEVLGAQMKPGDECIFCGRGDYDHVTTSMFKTVVKESQTILTNLAKLDLGTRALDIEEKKIGVIILSVVHAIQTALPGTNHVQMGGVRREFIAKLRELEKNPPEARDIVWT